ncbi:hypothetical protein RA19_06610 [Leisingera sp. ANG-M1]|uniref:DUF1127 domain-containing protein n=1 Tax=Leisingera sp. ANG-M1 TaxID=1577895 RepID=UPI000580644C|nr:DUF1127 domain-containing protein [Leisingera sp. ANG-M1]KIC11683.1 hypothetical protein RA19_06610 [Leisingera sp. ANG-M1]
MAYSTLSAPASSSLTARLRSLAASLIQDWKLRREYKRTVTELRGLSARELADIGLDRSSIPGTARENVYGR